MKHKLVWLGSFIIALIFAIPPTTTQAYNCVEICNGTCSKSQNAAPIDCYEWIYLCPNDWGGYYYDRSLTDEGPWWGDCRKIGSECRTEYYFCNGTDTSCSGGLTCVDCRDPNHTRTHTKGCCICNVSPTPPGGGGGGGGNSSCYERDARVCSDNRFVRSASYLYVDSVTNTTADLRWTKGVGDRQIIRVCKYPKHVRYDSTCEIIQTLSNDDQQYIATGLEPGTKYRFIIRTETRCADGSYEGVWSRCYPEFTTLDQSPPTCDLNNIPNTLTYDGKAYTPLRNTTYDNQFGTVGGNPGASHLAGATLLKRLYLLFWCLSVSSVDEIWARQRLAPTNLCNLWVGSSCGGLVAASIGLALLGITVLGIWASPHRRPSVSSVDKIRATSRSPLHANLRNLCNLRFVSFPPAFDFGLRYAHPAAQAGFVAGHHRTGHPGITLIGVHRWILSYPASTFNPR